MVVLETIAKCVRGQTFLTMLRSNYNASTVFSCILPAPFPLKSAGKNWGEHYMQEKRIPTGLEIWWQGSGGRVNYLCILLLQNFWT